MKDPNYPNYMEIKAFALSHFEKEFVLDNAPSCYEKSNTIDEFLSNMRDLHKRQMEQLRNIELKELHVKILLYKVELLEIELRKIEMFRKQDYEKAVAIRDDADRVNHLLSELKMDLTNRFDELENTISNYNEKQRIRNVLLEFKTIDEDFKQEVCILLHEKLEELKTRSEELNKDWKFKEASMLLDESRSIKNFILSLKL